MIDNFEYTYLPKGKVIICACDQVYFEIYGDRKNYYLNKLTHFDLRPKKFLNERK